MPSPFHEDRGTVRLIEPPDFDRAAIRRALVTGTYAKPFIVEQDGARSLHFSRDFVQSEMRIDDPYALQFAYTRKTMGFLLFDEDPREILLLGLGGGSLAKYCHRHLPAARITVVEIDPWVVAFRDEFRVPPDDPRFRVVLGDAAEFVARCTERPDVVVMDAFDRAGLAPTVASREFYADVRDAMARRGVLVANLVGEKARRLEQLRTIRSVFGGNAILVPVEEDGNELAFAFRDPRFEPRWRRIAGQARAMRERYGLDFPRFAGRLERSRKLGYLQRALGSCG